ARLYAGDQPPLRLRAGAVGAEEDERSVPAYVEVDALDGLDGLPRLGRERLAEVAGPDHRFARHPADPTKVRRQSPPACRRARPRASRRRVRATRPRARSERSATA